MTSPSWKATLAHPAAPTLARHLEDLRVHVHPDDLALRPDQLGHEEGDVTGAASHVQHPIPP
jgi:hypothetical protein